MITERMSKCYMKQNCLLVARLLLENEDGLGSKLKYRNDFSIAGRLLALAFAFFENLHQEPL